MARYSIGDVVAVVNRYELVGRIIEIDEKGKGYKVQTSGGTAYRYEKEIVLISLANSSCSPQVIKKLDAAGKQVLGFDSIREPIISFLQSGSNLAKAFADYVVKVSTDVLISLLKAIKDSGLNSTINLRIGFIIVNN